MLPLLVIACKARVEADPSPPFQRLVPALSAGEERAEVKRKIGPEYRDEFFAVDSYRSGKTTVTLKADYTFRLGDLVDFDALSPSPIGLIVAVDTGLTRNYIHIPFQANWSADRLAEGRVSALPPRVATLPGRALTEASAWAAEVLPLPREQRSEPIQIPKNAYLSFSVGLEDLFHDAKNEVATSTALAYGDGPPPAQFTVIAEYESGSTKLYSRLVTADAADVGRQTWIDETLNLNSLAGKEVTFVFRNDRAALAGLGSITSAIGLALWGSPIVHHKAVDAPRPGPNIILISLDTLRADHLGCYGYPLETSPNLDAFAKESFLFEHCYSTSSWTLPAHASVFTGLLVAIHRAGTRERWRVDDSLTTLPEIAADRGYLTAAFTQGLFVAGALGFVQGFDRYSDGTVDQNLVSQREHPEPYRAEKIFKQGERWLDEFGDNPFFLFMHTYEIHTPYSPPPEFARRFGVEPGEDNIPTPEIDSQKERDRFRALYDAEIAYTDYVLGTFFDYLKRNGILENTMVVIFSDHGEEFWEHGGVIHGLTLYREQLHVPLIVRLPGTTPASGTVSHIVSTADIFSTLIDAMGSGYTHPSSSISLTPFMAREPPKTRPTRDVIQSEMFQLKRGYYLISGTSLRNKYIAQTYYNRPLSPMHPKPDDDEDLFFAGGEIALLNFLGLAKLQRSKPITQEERDRLLRSGTEVYYDLASDPGETTSIADADPFGVHTIREALLAQLRTSHDEALAARLSTSETEPLTEIEIESLKALGYLQ